MMVIMSLICTVTYRRLWSHNSIS